MRVLAFSTGGAHITTMLGMLEELETQGRLKDVDSFAGISAGAILAAFCATRPVQKAVQELKSLLLEHCKDAIKPHYAFLNVPLSALFQKSILDDTGLAKLLQEKLESAKLHSDLYVGLTNETKMSYELHHFEKSSNKSSGALTISQAVHASASIPVIFKGEDGPNKCHYSDGGVYHHIPAFAIERIMEQAVKKEKKEFYVTVISSSTWNYRPALKDTKYPFLAQKTLHYLDCANYNNLPSDRELIKEAIALYQHKLNITFEMFAVPTVLLRKLHNTFTMTKLASMKENDVNKLFQLGRHIVKANCATYDISQDEPSPFMSHLKY